jgi:ketosteroid isomerase-like protein
MQIAHLAFATWLFLLTGCATSSTQAEPVDLSRQVRATETAFARTMADRDHQGFVSFLSDETVFFTEKAALRGKQQVADWWKRFYDGPVAPFSWEPQRVEVLDSGTLALSSGPVRSSDGKQIGTFTSIWRLEGPGIWRIIFDKGCNACPEQDAGGS